MQDAELEVLLADLELRPHSQATLADFNLALFRALYLPSLVAADVLTQNQRTQLDQLRSLRFVDRSGTPTHLGLLVIGRAPEEFIGGAYVQLLRLDGGSLASPIRSEKRLAGPLVQLLRQLDETLRLQVRTEVDLVSQTTEKRRFDYPLPALEQLARNAILARRNRRGSAPQQVLLDPPLGRYRARPLELRCRERCEKRSGSGGVPASVAEGFGRSGRVVSRICAVDRAKRESSIHDRIPRSASLAESVRSERDLR